MASKQLIDGFFIAAKSLLLIYAAALIVTHWGEIRHPQPSPCASYGMFGSAR